MIQYHEHNEKRNQNILNLATYFCTPYIFVTNFDSIVIKHKKTGAFKTIAEQWQHKADEIKKKINYSANKNAKNPDPFDEYWTETTVQTFFESITKDPAMIKELVETYNNLQEIEIAHAKRYSLTKDDKW